MPFDTAANLLDFKHFSWFLSNLSTEPILLLCYTHALISDCIFNFLLLIELVSSEQICSTLIPFNVTEEPQGGNASVEIKLTTNSLTSTYGPGIDVTSKCIWQNERMWYAFQFTNNIGIRFLTKDWFLFFFSAYIVNILIQVH